ncbi:MAG: DegT/DnrJ/EryC1/StrS family aminotransferase [Bdellovibrionota bacterium]
MAVTRVPFIDLLRFENGFIESVGSRVNEALRTGHFVSGPEVESCRSALQKYSQSESVALCANGTDAIQLALRAAGVGVGDKVIVPNMTFWASFEAVANVGAEPIPVDVEWETLHLSLAKVEEACEKFKPRALLMVHLYGWAAPDTLAIRDFCKTKKVLLIEDSAQAWGTTLDGKSVIGEAPIATTSFYPAKVLGASGDAGAVFAKDPAVCELATRLSNHGRLDHYEHGWVGWNSRVGVYESIFLEESLKHIDARLASRRRVTQLYRMELSGLPLEFLSPAKGVGENGYLSVARIDAALRPKLIDFLKSKSIGHGTVYPGAMSRQPGTKGWMKQSLDTGSADRIAKSVLNLPCFASMNDDEVSYVIDNVKHYFKAQI